jgi:hypothetical protein
MKKIGYSLFIVFLILIPGCSTDSGKLKGVVIFIHGTLKINHQKAVVGSRVSIDDTLSASAESLAVIQISDTVLITIRSDTQIKFVDLSKNKNDSEVVALFLTRGTVFNKVLKKGTDYSIKTEVIVASVRGTSFEVTDDGSKNKINLLTGKVDIAKISGSGSTGGVHLTEGMSVEATAEMIGEPVLLDKADIDNLSKYDAIEPVNDVEKTFPEPDKAGGAESRSLKETQKIDIIPEKYKEYIINNEMPGYDAPGIKKNEFAPSQAALKTLMNKENRTLADIKNVFKRTDEISLYSGRVIKGAIVSRGDKFSVLTPEGMVSVPMKEIQNVKVIK